MSKKKTTIILADCGKIAPQGKEYRVREIINNNNYRIGDYLSVTEVSALCAIKDWTVKIK